MEKLSYDSYHHYDTVSLRSDADRQENTHMNIQMAALAGVPRSQMERLCFMEARLFFLGELQRKNVEDRFAVAQAQVSRDISLYKRLAPHNLVYDFRSRAFYPSEKFKNTFNFSTENVLWWLKTGLGDGLPHMPSLHAEGVSQLCTPDTEILAKVTRAIYLRKVLDIRYLSLSSGQKLRKVIPHALVDTGKRWHVRAFDKKNGRFSDFVINRIQDARLTEDPIASHEEPTADDQWAQEVKLILVPHPGVRQSSAIKADYKMVGGKIEVKCRAAIAGYALRSWGVDCSANFSLSPEEYQLALRNSEVLKGIESAKLAPGFGKTKVNHE